MEWMFGGLRLKFSFIILSISLSRDLPLPAVCLIDWESQWDRQREYRALMHVCVWAYTSMYSIIYIASICMNTCLLTPISLSVFVSACIIIYPSLDSSVSPSIPMHMRRECWAIWDWAQTAAASSSCSSHPPPAPSILLWQVGHKSAFVPLSDWNWCHRPQLPSMPI